MSRRLFIYSVIYDLRTDDLDGTSTVSINTAETNQQNECSTIIGDLQEHNTTIFGQYCSASCTEQSVCITERGPADPLHRRVGCAP